jgi:hypothetical protein
MLLLELIVNLKAYLGDQALLELLASRRAFFGKINTSILLISQIPEFREYGPKN